MEKVELEIGEMLGRLAVIVAQEVGGTLTSSDVSADFPLDLDRLTRLSILTAVEDEFGARLDLCGPGYATVRDLAEAVLAD